METNVSIMGIFNFTGKGKRPQTVPKEAQWNEDEGEWELGKRNENGDEVGEWKWWLTPNGHLCCHTFFNDKGQMISATRYHPNGEVSLEFSYDEQGEEISTYYKSNDETTELFPDIAFKNAWKAVQKAGSSPISYNYYDKKGNLLSADNTGITPYLKGSANESAKHAIERLKKAIALLKVNDELDEEEMDEIDDEHSPYCIQEVSDEQLKILENRLGVAFPPSYRDFVLEYGLIGFGEGNDNHRKMFLDYSSMSYELKYNGELAIDVDLSEKEKDCLDKIVTFSFGDEGLQLEWFHCFDYNTLNPESGEVLVVDFDQDDVFALTNHSKKHCQIKGFDKHISKIVDEEIERILNHLGMDVE